MRHVVLLGDSIFDNARYVPGGPPVIEQLRAALTVEWRATLLAVDGAMAGDLLRQFARLPADATHLVVSVGGNDALLHSGIIGDKTATAAAGFAAVADAQGQFRTDYQDVMRAVRAVGKPTVLCTIYDSVPGLPRESATALSVFNDVILREAFQAALPVIDLRFVCNRPGDYSHVSSIEPSAVGGAKIASAIATVATTHDFTTGKSVVYFK